MLLVTPRALSFVAVALLAVGASAGVVMNRAWHLDSRVSLLEKEDGVRLLVSERSGPCAGSIGCVNLTNEEAAHLGRALLEAARYPAKDEGEPEKRGCRKSVTRADSYYCGSLTGEVFWIRKDQVEIVP